MPEKSFSYRLAERIATAITSWATVRTWEGFGHVPAGGCIVVSNHLSHADPITLGHSLVDHGYVPRFMAKDSLFHVPVFGRIMHNAGQIPVVRQSASAAEAVQAAVDAVLAGEMLVVYPEGTLTRDPDLWPMRGKTGAARIALRTGCPVIPVGQWGPQNLWAPFAGAPRLRPDVPVHLRAGPPVDLSGLDSGAKSLLRATDRIMDAITGIVADLRGQRPPDKRWNPRAHGQSETGKLNRGNR